MRIQALLLLALIALGLSSEIIVFGENAVNAIFKEKKETVILFTQSDGGDIQEAFTAAA
jgi:hypothetical protein